MLAGLIFATEDAVDQPGTLAATLPFAGMTLLEYQVGLLVDAGAGQVMVAVARVTPALLGAVARAAKRGVPVDIVRSAEEAAVKAHPLSHVLVFADSLLTVDSVIDRMANAGGEALLVTEDASSPAAVERLDMRDCWAGMARIPAHYLAAIAQMPDDWDFQSALLRAAVQARAEHVALTPGWARAGHAVVRSGAELSERSADIIGGLTERRPNWADRWIFTRAAQFAVPHLVQRNVPVPALIAGGAVLGLSGFALAMFGRDGVGLVLVLLATAVLACSSVLALLRGDRRSVAASDLAATGLSGATLCAIAAVAARVQDSATPVVLVIAAVALQLLVERSGARPRRWWASPAAYPLLLLPFAAMDWATAGLAICAIYAFATLAVAVEDNREKP